MNIKNTNLKNNFINDNLERGFLIVNSNGKIIGLNEKTEELFQLPEKEIINKQLDRFLATGIDFSDSIPDQDLKINNVKLNINDNRDLTIDLKASSFYLQDQKLFKFSLFKMDKELEEQINILSNFPDKNPNPTFRISATGELLYTNQAGEGIISKLKDPDNNTTPASWDDFTAEFITSKEKKKIKVKLNNKVFLFQGVGLADYDSIYLYGRDITKFKQTQEDIEKLINYDFLTGLPNRSLFVDKLEETLSVAREYNNLVAVLFIDLDNFKKVNDSLGHEMGDRLLSNIAQRLRQLITEKDFLARLSGDEFGIIVTGRKNLNQISNLLEKLTRNFSRPFQIAKSSGEDKEVFMTSSIGAAIYPDDSKNIEHLIKNSETAKNKVKENGKNHYRFYSDEMNEEVLEDLELEAKLRYAIDNEEFVLHYQPQIDLKENKVFGVEALIRWESPELGMVSPGRFIPLAEKSGLIIPIGDWVLKQSCVEAKELRETGFSDLKMGVNLSARQFEDDELINKITDILDEVNLAPEALELEITESIIMQNIEGSIRKLIKLRELGVNFSIDDFGTGYSSLSYLKQFPIGTLKIDRSFVDELPGDQNDIAIVKAIIDLAHNLDLNVIAEGVENVEHVEFLEDNQCDRIQGYYFGRPMSREELVKFLNNDQWKNNDN